VPDSVAAGNSLMQLDARSKVDRSEVGGPSYGIRYLCRGVLAMSEDVVAIPALGQLTSTELPSRP